MSIIKRKSVSIIISLFIAVLLSGCSLTGIDAHGLMTAPKSNKDQQKIYEVLKGNQEDIDFCYPKAGDYRSAIIMEDFTGDSLKDSIGFCTAPGGRGIKLQFINKYDDENWRSIAEFTNSATQIDRVYFADMTGDGQNEVIVGWGSAQSMTASVCIYRYIDGAIKEYPLGLSYSEMTLTDFTEDGIPEIFTATLYSQRDSDIPITADAIGRVYTFGTDYPSVAYSTRLNSDVVDYTNLKFEVMDNGTSALIIDGAAADSSQLTQVFTLNKDKGALISPLSVKSIVRKYNYFNRPSSLPLICEDIDGDGFTEFPITNLTVGHSSDILHNSTSYRVDWVKYNPITSDNEPIISSIYNFNENYMVNIPTKLRYNIICYNDSDTRELVFHKVKVTPDYQVDSSEKLFTIKVFTAEDWRKEIESRNNLYEMLPQSNRENIYAVQKFKDNDNINEIIGSFTLINK